MHRAGLELHHVQMERIEILEVTIILVTTQTPVLTLNLTRLSVAANMDRHLKSDKKRASTSGSAGAFISYNNVLK